MMTISCKRCGAAHYTKNGTVRGLQRYRCKACGCNFTATKPRGKPAAMKALAVLLYAMANVSFGSIARLLNVSDVAVLKWIRAEAGSLPEPEIACDLVAITLDEMWHFLQKKQKSFGSGEPMILLTGEPWPGFWVGVTMPPAKGFSIKSVRKAGNSSPTIGKAIIASSRKNNSSLAKP
jgi:transposase